MSAKVNSPAQEGQDMNHSTTEADATLEMNDKSTSPVSSQVHKEQNKDDSSPGAVATLDEAPPHSQNSASPVHNDSNAPTISTSADMDQTREQEQGNNQDACLLFRLPPELRNAIYTYVFYSKYSLPQFEWDEEHDSPKLNLKCAQPRAPPNELLRTCRNIHNESKGIYVKAKTQFWSDTTFTLALAAGAARDPSNFFRYLECLLNEQVNHITRVNIDIHYSRSFTVHLRSGSDAKDGVPVRPIACIHQVWRPAPLSFVKSVEAIDQVQGQLLYQDVRDILAHWWERPGSTYMHLCMEHHPEPVVLSVRDLSRAGLMAVVAWTCQG